MIKGIDHTTVSDVEQWAKDQGIFERHDSGDQAEKVLEEVEELMIAVADGDLEKIKDEYGDVLVSLTVLASILGLPMDEAMQQACIKNEWRAREAQDGI